MARQNIPMHRVSGPVHCPAFSASASLAPEAADAILHDDWQLRPQIVAAIEPAVGLLEHEMVFDQQAPFRLVQFGRFHIPAGSAIIVRRAGGQMARIVAVQPPPAIGIFLVAGEPRIELAGDDERIVGPAAHGFQRCAQADFFEQRHVGR